MAVATSLASLLEKLKVEEPYLRPRNWESLHSQSGRFPLPIRASPPSSSSVSESSLVRLALNALQGVESSLISIGKLSSLLCSEPADRTTHHIPSLWHRLSSTDALGQILRDIGCFGSLVFLLHSFVGHFTSLKLEVEGQGSCYTLVNQAFAIAVRKVLEGYISGLDTLCASVQLRRSSNIVDGSGRGPSSLGCLTNVVHPNITLLEVFLHTRELRTQIEALANICDLYDISLSYCVSPWECLFTEATTQFHGFYKGSDLLTYLYSQLKVADPAHSAMVKFLFLKTCEPYWEFIRSWIYKAELNDPHKEFIVECITESTSFSWNTAGISRLKRAREQEGGLVPCFLDGFLEPILRAGQQLQVITKLLELCNLSASGLRNYADLLPYWTHYSSSSLVYPSPITFSKLHIEVMIQKRDDYYRRMQEKLCDLSRKFELFLGQVPGATSLPISFGDGERLEKSSGNFTLDESLLVPSTVAMDLARDQSGSESDDQKTEDRWFSEIDASCSSESSSTRDFSESDVGMLDFQSTLAGPLPNYLSALRFSVASAGKCDENLAQHGESGYIDNNFVTKDEKADTHRQWMDIEPEESTEACEVDKFRGLLSIKSWPLGGLPRNPFIVDKHAEDDKQYQPTDSGDKMEQRGSMNTDESTLLLNNIPTGISCLKQERKHDLLENCSSSKLYLLKETKVNSPYEVLSMNPMLRCDFLRKNGNINRRDQAKLLPWFDFSAVDNPSKTCLARIPVGFRVDDSLEYHSSQTDRKSHFHANQECGIDSPDVEDPKVSCSHLSSGFKGRAEENKSNVPGGSRWEGMLLRSNNPETSALSDCRQSSSPTFELPLDFVIDKCLLQEILLQGVFVSFLTKTRHDCSRITFPLTKNRYNFVSKLAIKLLEEGFGLKEHLLALRRYHFMELADWADVFVVSLWHHKWLVTEADKRIAEIQGFLESSIQRSSCERDTCKDRLFLYKRQGTMHLPPSTIGVRSFDFLGLGYRVDWPISIIVTCDALKAYADVFSFLVQVKLAAYALTDVWCSLKDVRHTMHENKEGIAKQELRWLNILMKLRHQVNHFVSTLQQYVHSELSHVSWSKFLHSLKNKSALSITSVKIAYWYWFNIIFLATLKPVKDMMDLESVHMVYLSEALSICFLSDETRVVSNVIENILQCALDFRSCLPQGTGRVPNDSWTNTLGIDTCQVMMVKQKFEKEMKDLYMCHRRSPKHGRFGLSRFWDCLNFNLYYSEILHDSNIFPLIP
ncbi:hypothetical protein F2Q69_00006695 [Brassica cretica]|uniref:Gamma-tubulin complex component n=1 Tax=Brassica cretica TaxID=69181 RepID=A0A8S9PJ22_BRACR|nr:hypothetical protein F2Q69_00006695 [Brassica cretica]